MVKRYSRKTTGITISIFYEHYQLKKFNFDPPYQRDYNVWSDEQKSFLIDTIMKNFPMPPIFLEQKIDDNGRTTFDVIDGKQRLTAIKDFIEGKVRLPNTFGNDQYGDSRLNNLSFNEIKELSKKEDKLKVYISNFWSYVINIEYIENPDEKIVDNIFDRLNRGGERLTPQELRKANYYDTALFQEIFKTRKDKFVSDLLRRLDKHRLEDVSFITEIYLLLILNKIIDGTEQKIDDNFKNLVDKIKIDEAKEFTNDFHSIKEIVKSFDLDYDKFNIRGVSHLYAIWYIAFFIYKENLDADLNHVKQKLNEFYNDLRNDKKIPQTNEYHKSMQSASKSRHSRKRRVCALLEFLEFKFDRNKL